MQKSFVHLIYFPFFISSLIGQLSIQQHLDYVKQTKMQVVCNNDGILLKMNTNAPFNGMVYAKDAPSNPNCMAEFNGATNMTYRLPLKACGTLFSEVDDGIEYFNTVVVQPHMRLMTNQGKGYHIRCKYQTRERTIANTQFNVSASFLMQDAPKSTTPLLATASMPSCTMKIFRKGRSDIAESVKIGDKLVMVIEIDRQDMYGMRISNCVVRDGLNVAEQLLIDANGCPLDETIMPSFEYTNNSTRAAVSFPAHKFPHTSSVYYQCNISLCINNGNCVPVDCKHHQQQQQNGASTNSNGSNSQTGNSTPGGSRRKRHSNSDPGNKLNGNINGNAIHNSIGDSASRFDDMSFDVYSGLFVNDINDEDRLPLENDEEIAATIPVKSMTSDRNGMYNLIDYVTQRGLTFVLIGMVTFVGILALVCQLGLIGFGSSTIDQQVASTSAVQLTRSGRHGQQILKNSGSPQYHLYDCN